MSGTTLRLLAIESPDPDDHFILRLLEPPGSCRKSLWERLSQGNYDKPFILDSGMRRFLQFDFNAVQSSMYLTHPDRLSLAYTRKMMAFLLFNRTPGRILLLGLGGGSLAKFCYQRLPRTAVTAIEVNPQVIALRNAFGIPTDNDRFRVICADGAKYVARIRRPKDVILADACDRVGVAPELDAIEFYQNAYRSLSRGGVFVTNLCGDMNSCAAHIAKIRDVFAGKVLSLRVRHGGNVIVFGFKEHRPDIDWEQLAAAAPGLKIRFGLDFPHYVRRLALDWKLRRLEHAFI